MDSKEFINKCKELVKDYTNEHLDKTDNKEIERLKSKNHLAQRRQ